MEIRKQWRLLWRDGTWIVLEGTKTQFVYYLNFTPAILSALKETYGEEPDIIMPFAAHSSWRKHRVGNAEACTEVSDLGRRLG